MDIEFKCPQCGQMVEADASHRGRVVECPHCTKGIVVPKGNASTNNANLQRQKVIHIRCPHCGTEYEATQQDMHHLVSCEICGKHFVAGATFSRQKQDFSQPRPTVQASSPEAVTSRSNHVPRSRPFIAVGNVAPEPRKSKLTIWIAVGAACLAIMTAFAFILGRYSNKSDSPAKAVAMMRGDDGNQSMGVEAPIQVESIDRVEADTNIQDVTTSVDAAKRRTLSENSNKPSAKDDIISVIEKICRGERLGGEEWENRLHREFGESKAAAHLKEELARAGYWALRIEAPGVTIHVGHLTDSADGFIKEGLGGGFTYPKWLPAADAEYIYNAYLRLEKEEIAFKERIRKIDLAFRASEFYITPEEEERIEQAARLEYAQPLLSSICFDSSRYIFCQKRLQKSLVSAEITDRRWEQLKDAQSKREWLKMINIICGASKNDDEVVMFDKFPNTESIANAYKAILDYKWTVKVVFRKTGIKWASQFESISNLLQKRMSEREIVARYGQDWTEYNKLKNALRSISNTAVPYPVDLQVRVGRVDRYGVINGFNGGVDYNFKENGTFEFMIGEGSAYVLFVDDEWYWTQEFADTERKYMEKYENARQAYLSDVLSLLKEANLGRYDKVQTATLRHDKVTKHSPILFSAISQFMGTKVALPPCPAKPPSDKGDNESLNAESDDYELDSFLIEQELLGSKENRFKEYERERLEREKLFEQWDGNSGYRSLNTPRSGNRSLNTPRSGDRSQNTPRSGDRSQNTPRSGSKPYKWSKKL